MPLKPPIRLIIGLAVAILLDTVTQLLWKTAVSDLPEAASAWEFAWAACQQPKFLLVIGLMLSQFGNWMIVLKHSDLSFAHAVTALSYVTVAVASWLWLGERGGLTQSLGIAFIMAGVWLVSRTGHMTAPRDGSETP